MKKFQTIIALIFMVLMLSTGAGKSYAFVQASASSAKLDPEIEIKPQDNRAEILESFLQSYGSPLAPYASDFVANADKYNLDWRLVASIAGLESTFGKHIPNCSYNAWGWGVYGTNVIRFVSWSEGIETISKGLRENYLRDNPESNPFIIGPTYAASPTWAQRVTYFMNRIEEFQIRNGKSTLALAL